ncbi:accessory factor UbiK family protein [Novispirillum sp. DQ9]|uniref:accessory factor UbiK family protein n=1 Tax=Novispirillum sp. DQ9 TaxID=3398612 RepID=UPI003C7EB03C
MQTQNRLFDDLARVAGGALGALTGLRDEIELLVRQRMERVLADMDLVPRDEFDAVKAMAAEARAENERLAARVAELEKARTKAATSGAAATRRRATRRTVIMPKKAAVAAGTTPPPDDTTPPPEPEGTPEG